MPKFSANLSVLFTELDMLDRFATAADSGFRGVECQFPYEFDKDALAERLDESRLAMVLHNLPPGDWDGGDRGIACLPGRVGEFQDGVGLAIDYARALRCPSVNCLAGVAPAGADRERLAETLTANLCFAADCFAEAGIRLLVEAINTHDMPGFFVNRTAQAAAILEATERSNVALQFDVYHAVSMGEDPAVMVERFGPRIGHVQIADAPGRHEPGSGAIDFAAFFDLLDRVRYDGWVGCEYRPATTTAAGLAWIGPYLDTAID